MATKMKKHPVHENDRHPHMDDGDAFVPDVARSHERLIDDDAEAFAEEFMVTATSAEDVGEEARDEVVSDDLAAYDIFPDDDDAAGLLFVETELRLAGGRV